MTIATDGNEVRVEKDGEVLCKCDVHDLPGCLYVSDLTSNNDGEALLKLIRYVLDHTKNAHTYLHLDVRDPDVWRLLRLYSRIGTVEYVSFKLNPQ